jgi:hypothetical protein
LYSTRCPGKYDTANNNSFATAAVIPLNKDIYGAIESAGDVDYYKFTTSAAGFVTINLTNLPKNYNLYLYTGLNVLLDSSAKTGIAAEKIYRKLGKNNFYVKVIGAGSGVYAAGQCYKLSVVPDVTGKDNDNIPVSLKAAMQLYPNPAHTNVNIAAANTPANAVIKITDVFGRSVMQVKAQQDNTNVNISKLTSGTYMVTIISKEGTVLHTTKFIKY